MVEIKMGVVKGRLFHFYVYRGEAIVISQEMERKSGARHNAVVGMTRKVNELGVSVTQSYWLIQNATNGWVYDAKGNVCKEPAKFFGDLPY